MSNPFSDSSSTGVPQPTTYQPSNPTNLSSSSSSVPNGERIDALPVQSPPTSQSETTQKAVHGSTTKYHSFFYEIFTWKNPAKSGIAYTTTLFLILFRFLSLSRYLFMGAWMLFLGVVSIEALGKFVLKNHQTVNQFKPAQYYYVPESVSQPIAQELTSLVNFFIVEVQKLVFVEKLSHTTVALVVSYISYKLVTLLPLWVISIIAVNIVFMAPPVYLANHEAIDGQIARGQQLASQHIENARQQASVYTDKAVTSARGYAGQASARVNRTGASKPSSVPVSDPSVSKEPIVPPTNTTAPTTIPAQ